MRVGAIKAPTFYKGILTYINLRDRRVAKIKGNLNLIYSYLSELQNKNSIPLPSEQILGGIKPDTIIPNSLPQLKSFNELLVEVKRKHGHK